jgi:esterase
MTNSPTLNTIETGAGPTIVLLHGLFGTAGNLGIIQRHLQNRYRVIAMDIRNHGGSPHIPGMDYGEMAADVLRTIDRAGVERFAVIGHSMGGKVAMRLGLTYPERVANLSVLDIAPIRYKPAFRPYADAMLALPLDRPLSRRDADAFLTTAIEDPRIRSFLLLNLRCGEQPAWRIGLENISDGLGDVESWKPPLSAPCCSPTIFIAGAASDYVSNPPPPVIEASFPDSRVLFVENAGHWLHADNPDRVLALIDQFYANQKF